MTDLTAPAARGERDQLAGRTDVLDKVGVVRTLPDDMHVTTDNVAQFYAVDRETVLTVVKRNRDELDDDGYRVVTRGAFEETFKMNVPSTASRIALFPRRAVLRVGMLLRDSEVAKEVRSYLLDIEQAAPRELGGAELLARAVLEAQSMLAAKDQQIAELEPKANYVDTFVTDEDVLSFSTVASTLGLQASKLREVLITHGWIYKETATRWSHTEQQKKTVNRYSEYSHKKAYFQRVENHEAPRFRGEVMHTLKVTAAGANALSRMIPRWQAGDAA